MSKSTLSYPTPEEVERAERYTICYWYRKLPDSNCLEQEIILRRICERFKELGGFTAEISKSIGW